MRIIVWTISLACFWLLLSGFFQPLLLSFGVISVALVLWLMVRMDDEDATLQNLRLGPKKIGYAIWLCGQIVLSSIQVAKAVWQSPKKLNPAVGKVTTTKLDHEGRVLYANSITLTPGTLSIDLDDDSVMVHALQSESLSELRDGEMENRIAKMISSDKQDKSS